ncbi:hypothetical protein PI860_16860 [Aeromonas salmonicida subsp. salmonicida]|nr:hypothetical protein [Aeromonas salmonicida]MCK3680477.1 hypothetical protein [Aeromonas salmonicida subsp. salmonicida]MCR4453179.1 hypothetical protein [Aeromonas salmonicida]UDQ59247.1 hypothetical protein LJF99_05255 [Aeromonas salmonicida subsp. salmonicida]UYZ31112.1 hypothetical protein AXW80_05350 [Aeromonas salmonicida subsp. salmonicida]WCB49306.1 hypothetical protein PI860_16860 [Aeromonas salmonicida subsp. salmonicida]
MIDKIMASCFQSFNMTTIDFQHSLNVPLFNEVIDVFRRDWNSVIYDSNAVQTMMQRHHDNLLYFLMSRNSHIYRVLIGSVNYFYANIITLMMALVDAEPDEFERKMIEAKSILDRFFDESKAIYADAFQRQDSTYFAGLNVFKHT